MGKYHEILKAEGYEAVSDLRTITATDLRALGITKQMHIKRILMKNGQGISGINANEGTSQGTGTSAASSAPGAGSTYPTPSYGNAAAVPPVYDQEAPPPAYVEGNDEHPPSYIEPPTYR